MCKFEAIVPAAPERRALGNTPLVCQPAPRGMVCTPPFRRVARRTPPTASSITACIVVPGHRSARSVGDIPLWVAAGG